VELVVPLVAEKEEIVAEKISDLVERQLLQEGPLAQPIHCLMPEVKEKADASDKVMEGLGFQLPYTESWDHFPDLSQGTEPLPESKGFYHRSATGLCVKEILPFLLVPSSLLANSRSFEFKNSSLVGESHIRRVKLPSRKLLTRNAALAVEGEATLRVFTQLDVKDKDRIRYFRNLRIIRFYVATWDALMFSFQLVRTTSTAAHKAGKTITWRVNADLKRQIERFRVKLLLQPYKTAKELKELAGHARAWFFGAKKPSQPLLRTLPSKYYALVFSYMGRALPPQARSDTEAGYQKLVDRLTSEPPPEVVAWRPWVRTYLERFPVGEVSYPTDSSAGATLGYTRRDGGFSQATQDLVGLGLALIKVDAGLSDTLYDLEGNILTLSSVLENRDFKSLNLQGLNEVAVLQRLYSRAVNRAVEWTMERFSQIPFVALSAPEAGLKTRYPTISPVCVLHISQILRRAADSHLLRDPRNRESLGGKPEIRLGKLAGPWYSQDLTAATDLHPFWLQGVFYEELLAKHPKLEHLSKYLSKLFGPRKLISPNDYKSFMMQPEARLPQNPYKDLLSMHWEKALPNLSQVPYFTYEVGTSKLGSTVGNIPSANVSANLPKRELPAFDPQAAFLRYQSRKRTAKQRSTNRGLEIAEAHIAEWEAWWKEFDSLPGITTKTGNPMGEAASFPLLNLGTNFCAERAGLPKHGNTGDDSRIPLGQRGLPRVLLEHANDRSSKMNDLLRTLPADPSRRWQAEDKLKIHELSLSEIGAVLSRGDPREGKPNKIFIHKEYALYKEIPMRGDQKLPFIPVKLLSAPPGGAKGTISWFNQPTAVRQHCNEFQFHIPKSLWRKLPYWNETLAAFSYGLPVREAVMLGGVNHPVFPHTAGTNPRVTQRWLSTLSSLTLVEWATGTGLSPLPPAETQLVRSASKKWLEDIVLEEKSLQESEDTNKRRFSRLGFDPGLRGPLPTLKEAADEATRFASSYLLYSKGPVEFNNTPSIMTLSHKFHRRLNRGRIFLEKRKKGQFGPLTYAGTMEDMVKKNSVYLLDPDVNIPGRHTPRAFGLSESKFDPDRKPWRWDWLERSSSDDAFIHMFAQAVAGTSNPSAV
jgi:hypothetical protein